MSKVKDFKFDKAADSYDGGIMAKASYKFYNLLLSQVKVKPGGVVLDAGCGTGTVLRMMADKYGICGYGIDMEKNMISQAKKKCPDMDIRLSPCEHTPFENGQFDAITACMAYHHFSDRKGFAREAARILKPGGVLYICDPYFPWPVRKAINGSFKLFNVAGFFGSPLDILENFNKFGFTLEGAVRDGFAQVVRLRLNAHS